VLVQILSFKRGCGSSEKLRSDCKAIAKRLQSDIKAIAKRLQSDAIAMQLQSNCKAIV
jgi:hypothetical protein